MKAIAGRNAIEPCPSRCVDRQEEPHALTRLLTSVIDFVDRAVVVTWVLELVHRLATENSPFIDNILNNVIFVLVPSQNPDGQVIVTDWYMKNAGPVSRNRNGIHSPLPDDEDDVWW